MKIFLDCCHFEALKRAGYIPYTNNKWAFIKSVNPNNKDNEKIMESRYFHAIVDYFNRSISIHIDKPKKSGVGHSTQQKSPAIRNEINRIKKYV